ncbi:Cof-type HAD-IIB family hydrolase [Silvibacterium sp.]|uniref:Cof-type HAD-IIB family hydrolase n=1 Tax=Silvibacterium sp. TaxID=1964179 RepID=UPI0039E57E17
MVAIDIDGTLLHSAGTTISNRNRRVLREVQAAGIEVVIATGRRQAYAAPLLVPVGLRPETVFITSNGAVTRTFAGERIDRFTLPVETARELCPALRPFGGTTVFTFDREGPGELVLESAAQLHARISLWVDANRPWIEEVNPLERAFDSGEPPVQGMVCGTLPEMIRAEEWLATSELSSRIETHRTEYPRRDLCILDILPPGCSKGIALGRLAQSRGIDASEIMAIGDNLNDLEMLRYAGHPVVMTNAAPSLLATAKQSGWRIAPPNDHDGVAQVLESVLTSLNVTSGRGR